MNSHYDILRRAVGHIPEPDRRQELYDRARHVLAEQMRIAQPPIPQAVVAAQQSALEAAIDRIEDEFSQEASQQASQYADYAPAGPLDVAEPELPPVRGSGRTWAVVAVAAVAVVAVAGLGAFMLRGAPPAPQPSNKPIVTGETDLRIEIDDRSPPSASAANAPRSYTYGRQLTYYRTTHPAGTIIIDKGQRFLYLVRANTSAVRYGIGIGRECLDLPAIMQVTRKVAAQPGTKDEKDALGPRRVFLDTDVRFIHGTNRPDTIGRSVWTGCVRLANEDMTDLYDQAAVGGRVVVME
jgi:lipoprotein-anchoring transpeptidase ErfK/SrfK